MAELWLIILSVCAPVAGVVGFAVQLNSLKKSRLENEKLTLELEKIRKELEESKRNVVIASTEETERYARFSIRSDFPGPCPGDDESQLVTTIGQAISTYLILLLVFLFVAYLVYDAIRLIRWIIWCF